MHKEDRAEALALLRQYWPESGGQQSHAEAIKNQEAFLDALERTGWQSPWRHEEAVEAAYYDGMYAERISG